MALLFLLEPVVRGWDRYKWRWERSHPARSDPLDSGSGIEEHPGAEKTCYWSNAAVDRLTFLHRILAQLDEGGWENKWDAGWSHHDVEIFGSRWSRLRLTTVSEELGQSRKFLCCRLQATWSLPGLVVFWSLLLGNSS